MRKMIRSVAIVILLLIFCLSAYRFTSYYTQRRQDAVAFEQLQDIVRVSPDPSPASTIRSDMAKETEAPEASAVPALSVPTSASSTGRSQETARPETSASPTATHSAAPMVSNPAAPAPGEQAMLESYAALYAMNPDVFGWLRIEDTVVDYPVMHTPRDPQYYLYRDFYGEDSIGGVLFMEESCFTGCGNYLIHGHHMRDGSMFGTLDFYADEEYWKAHPVIHFDTMYEKGEYEIVAAFYAQVYTDGREGFRYYEYTDLTEIEIFEEYMEQVKAAALYDTGVDAEFGDELITLSTCEYHRKDGRFVVVARRIAPESAACE